MTLFPSTLNALSGGPALFVGFHGFLTFFITAKKLDEDASIKYVLTNMISFFAFCVSFS